MSDALEDLIRLACQAEALARKPGNVHPGASFSDLNVGDFLIAADAVAPILARASELGVGRAVHEAVRATRQRIATNANLGICLLLAPCAAAAARGGEFRESLREVLDGLTVDDARWAYQAIRLAAPGGLGEAPEQDVAAEPTVTLLEAMALAAERDAVARQYVTAFADLFEIAVPALARFVTHGPETAIVAAQLHLMAARPDTLIERKCGEVTARESSILARDVLDAGWPERGSERLADFDRWLRSDGNRRNPGTTADLIAASLFIALQEGVIEVAAVRQWCGGVLATIPPAATGRG